MTSVRKGVPVEVECGDVFEFEGRTGVAKWTREHAGSIGITGKTADRRQCGVSARYYVELSNGTYLAACSYHKDKLNGDSQ